MPIWESQKRTYPREVAVVCSEMRSSPDLWVLVSRRARGSGPPWSTTVADVDAQTPQTPPAGGVGTGTPLPREAADPGALKPLVPTGPPPVSLKRSRWRVVIAGILAIV